MDVVFIRGLEVDAVIGTYDWERQLRQRLVFNLELAADVRRAAASDEVADAVDYAAVAERVTEFVQTADARLVETLAERVANLIMAEFRVPWLRLELHKPRPLSGRLVAGVTIERGQRPPDPPTSSDHALHQERLRLLTQAADLGPQDPPYTDPTAAVRAE